MKKIYILILLIVFLGLGVVAVFHEIQKPSILIDKEINISDKNRYVFEFFNPVPGSYTVEMKLKLLSDVPLKIYNNSDGRSGYNGLIKIKLYEDKKLVVNNFFDRTWIAQHVGGDGEYIFYKLAEFTQKNSSNTHYLLSIDIEKGDPRFLRINPHITVVPNMTGYGLIPLIYWVYFLIIIMGIITFIVLRNKGTSKIAPTTIMAREILLL